ncbi:MAG TPA: OPT/YSL family transporter, partial [Candidatus Eisenbacteria bacterium]|nr:OPT/YSL family transporter [Candidatus Eisenbacteria bacterium]
LLGLNDAYSVYVPVNNNDPKLVRGTAAPDTVANPAEFHGKAAPNTNIAGPADTKEYNVWFHQPQGGGNAEKYLVDDSGKPVYYVDPGINGAIRELPGGKKVEKFDAPKATLMSYIIKGILGGELPWGLVLLGVMIAIVLELSGIPSLAFAVGVYLPLSSSSPILIGGLVRWGVDKWIAKKHAGKKLTEEQLVAEGDKSPGVLMASGYIAGGAIAGIIIALMLGVPRFAGINDYFGKLAESNPMVKDGVGDLLSLIPFLILIVLLYLTGREKILAHRESA